MKQYALGEVETQTTLSSTRWTGQRMRLAGLAGMISGLGLLVQELPRFLDTSVESEGTFVFTGLHLGLALVLALAGVVVLGAHALYGDRYGRLGRASVYGLGAAFGLISVGIAAYALAPSADPLAPVSDVGFFAMVLLTSAVGVLFWGKTDVNRVAAGLMGAVAPAFVLAIVLDEILGVVPESLAFLIFLLPLALGLAALGHHLWMNTNGDGGVHVATPEGR